MLNVLMVSDYNSGKNIIAAAYLKELGCQHFTVNYAGFEPGPINPLVGILMKLDGYDLTDCDSSCSVFDLCKGGHHYDIVITVCPKRLDAKCPNFPGQLLRLNWRHSDPDKIALSRIDRLQQTRIMRDSIKVDVINFIAEYEEGKWSALGKYHHF